MGLIHLDAGVVIGLLDFDDVHHETARAAIAEALDRADRMAVATSAFAECLVGPSRRGPEAVGLVHHLFERLPIELVALTPEIAGAAALLRARHRSLRLPDALVIATASERNADRLLTTDRRWPTAKQLGLPVTISAL